MISARGEITARLLAWNDGDDKARDELMSLVYHELRRLARGYLRRERNGHTLQPTALIHEAFIRLIDQSRVTWKNRAHFFGISARLMRQILINHARGTPRRKARRRWNARFTRPGRHHRVKARN